MSRREEIRHKEQLQARFQVSLAQMNSKVLSWMSEGSGNGSKNGQGDSAAVERRTFESLPIVSQGRGLNMGDEDEPDKGAKVLKVSDFLHSSTKGKKPSGRIAKTKHQSSESTSLRALRNKLRDSKRQRLRNSDSEAPKKVNGNTTKDDDESDSEDEVPRRTAKKVIKGRRPF